MGAKELDNLFADEYFEWIENEANGVLEARYPGQSIATQLIKSPDVLAFLLANATIGCFVASGEILIKAINLGIESCYQRK